MKTLVEKFYEEIKHEYNITIEECSDICNTPFKFIKNIMNSGVLKSIRLQYFGVFSVSSGKVKYTLENLKLKFNKGLLTEEEFIKRKNTLENYERKN